MSQMLKASGAMAAATMASRILGLGREMAYAAFMGNGWVASAFALAFQVPNLFRRLLGEGALTAAFIPMFKRKQHLEGETEMWRCANAVISGLVAATTAISVLVVLGISAALWWGKFSVETALMLRLLRLMFPYMVLVCLAAALIGMANARGHFFVPAMGAALLNVVMIASVLWLAPHMGRSLEEQVFGLAIGVLLAGLVQAFFQLPSLTREGFRYEWVSPWRDPTVREVVKKMLPGSIGVAAFQINVLLIQFFSYFFDKTVVATFNYSVRLMELPQGLFGISLATYLLPTLSQLAAEKRYPDFRSTLRQGLGHLAFANLIAAAISLGLAEPIVRLLFERGKFDADATARVAVSLMCLAPGLLMFSTNNILARAFYALEDIKTPMKVSVFCLCVNLVMSVWLVQRFREAGLAFANTLSASLNSGLLLYALKRRLGKLEMQELLQVLVRLVPLALSAGAMGFFLYRAWDRVVGHQTFTAKMGGVFVPLAVAGGIYFGIALALKVPAAREMFALAFRKRRTDT